VLIVKHCLYIFIVLIGSTHTIKIKRLKGLVMGSLAETQKLTQQLRLREDEIDKLKKDLRERDSRITNLEDEVQSLRSQLDKYQSVMTGTHRPSPVSSDAGPRKQRAQGISAEPQPQANDKLSQSIRKHSKAQSTRDLIKQAILDNDFMKNLETAQILEIVDCMHPFEYKKDNMIIKEGEVGSMVYVMEEGKVEVTKEGHKLCNMGPGKVFGELAILYNCTRTASVKALVNCKVWAIDRQCFQSIMMRTALQRQKQHLDFLKSVPSFTSLPEETLAKIADVLQEVHYENGEYVIRQGARGETFYIISKGKVKVTKRSSGATEDTFIRTLQRGDFFGEKALENDDVRTANIIASDAEGVDCLCLDRESYTQLIRNLEEIKKAYIDEDKKESTPPVGGPSSTATDEMSVLQLKHLLFVATLGVGGFGRVVLVSMRLDPQAMRSCVRQFYSYTNKFICQRVYKLLECVY